MPTDPKQQEGKRFNAFGNGMVSQRDEFSKVCQFGCCYPYTDLETAVRGHNQTSSHIMQVLPTLTVTQWKGTYSFKGASRTTADKSQDVMIKKSKGKDVRKGHI